MTSHPSLARIVVVGGGPAGLMAADVIASAGRAVTVYDRMPSMGRKLLMAGRGGLNLTHSEPLEVFLTRYGAGANRLTPAITAFPPAALQSWCESLGQPTFVGSSGRIFPRAFKASPLLRAWLHRLTRLGVILAPRHRWLGWDENGLALFAGPDGHSQAIATDAMLLALGGASWPRLGSDGLWVPILAAQNIGILPLRPANCGFVVPWSDSFRQRFQGRPVKPVTLSFGGTVRQGELMITAGGLEGGALYALSAPLRETIAATGQAILTLDLRPGLTAVELERRLLISRKGRSLSTTLRAAAGLSPEAIGLIREVSRAAIDQHPGALAARIKSLPVTLTATGSIERAISTAGGVDMVESLDGQFMLRTKPGVFVAGEMLDWEAPTGGYLLQAAFSTGVAAARGLLSWLEQNPE
jgi:hypothetical protein